MEIVKVKRREDAKANCRKEFAIFKEARIRKREEEEKKKSAVEYKMASGGEPPDKGGGSKDWNMEMQNEQTQPQNGKPAELKGQQDENNNAKISYTYVRSDVGPYRVFIELKNNTNGKASINKYTLGSYLRKIQGIHTYIQELQYAGKHKVIAILTNPEKANQLVTEINNSTSAYRAYVPRHVVSITGVITGIPIDLTEQEIQDDIQSKVPVMSVKRLHRYADGNKVLSLRVSVTFRAKELPDSVKVFCCPTRVYPFAQKLIFCTKCLRYGHRTENCRGRERCRNCGQIHELNEEYANCQEQQKCIYCKSTDHRSGATICDETQRQKALKSIMAKKNLTQLEARRLLPAKISNYYEPLSRQDEFPSISNSFANTVTRSQKPQRSRQRSRSNEDDKRMTSNAGHQQSKNTTTNEKDEEDYSRLVKRARQRGSAQKLEPYVNK